MTRFEPSVLRAAAMAALAAVDRHGRASAAPAPRARARRSPGCCSSTRCWSGRVGFQLSVGRRDRDRRWPRAPIGRGAPRAPVAAPSRSAVTLAAQLGVAPVLLAAFGPLPVASLPANLLAVPVAGLVMVWGLTAGLRRRRRSAGRSPTLLHAPDAGCCSGGSSWWPRRAARAPLGELGPAVARRAWRWPSGCWCSPSVAAPVVAATGRRPRRSPRRCSSAVVGAHAPPAAAHRARARRRALARGRHRGGRARRRQLASVARRRAVLAALRRAGVGADRPAGRGRRRRAAAGGGRGGRTAIRPAPCWSPCTVAPGDRPAGAAVVPPTGTAVEVGDLDVLIDAGRRPAGRRGLAAPVGRGPSGRFGPVDSDALVGGVGGARAGGGPRARTASTSATGRS